MNLFQYTPMFWVYLVAGIVLVAALVREYRKLCRELDERDQMRNTVQRLDRQEERAQEAAETPWARN